VVFSPLSKYLGGLFGPQSVNHAIAVTIAVVFLLIGIWHGLGWNYAAFGAVHALAVVTNHYYTIGLKRVLGREGFKKYHSSRVVHGCAVVLTFSYVAASLSLFANGIPEIKELLDVFRWNG
jgi:D-alanyl-lipoteichoic acid acyltransferase DltB (MBOAT superfamily)